MLFNHTKRASEKIYEMFEDGGHILPDDPICTKAVEITKSQNFSSTAFQEVLNRYHLIRIKYIILMTCNKEAFIL